MATLDGALKQFEAAEANLAKLEQLWARIEKLMPSSPAFGAPPEYDELCFAFRQVLSGLPAIDGFQVKDCLRDYDEVGRMHLDAAEIGDFESLLYAQSELEVQGKELREYRFRFQAKRRELVRGRLMELMDEIDAILEALKHEVAGCEIGAAVDAPRWPSLHDAIREVDTLIGAGSRPQRWGDIQRHLHFGKIGDFADILNHDWPSVRSSLASQLYGQYEPIPVTAGDLGEIVAARPSGPATTRLDWKALTDEDFERLVFLLISQAQGYENPEWLQKTYAPDRGRDLSVFRVESDLLGGVRRHRTIIQCKHWLSRSVGPSDVAAARSQMELWQPPRVDALIVATTGRFTADAVHLVEQHNQSDHALNIAMWPESHIERLLAARPHLIGQFQLRRGG